jgi:hypothetical protein
MTDVEAATCLAVDENRSILWAGTSAGNIKMWYKQQD